MILEDMNGKVYRFHHEDYEVGCGGKEIPMLWGNDGKAYLYVWNKVEERHEWYVYGSDIFIRDTDAPWMIQSKAFDKK
jgi:hypothetical protein